MAKSDDIDKLPLPKGWPKLVKHALVLVNSLLKAAFDIEVGRRLDCALYHTREHGEHQRLRLDCDAEQEQRELLHARFARLDPKNRTQYTKPERMRILELKAQMGWSAGETAKRFIVDEDTVQRWMKELASIDEEKLLAVEPPVNKFPQFVDRIVARMAVALPLPTKRKIATILARCGLHVSANTVADRMETPPEPTESEEADAKKPKAEKQKSGRTVAAHYENHIWNADFTAVPIRGGFWCPLPPFTWLQCWPFCWWVAVVQDMFSRKVMGFAVFKKVPTSLQTQRFLERVMSAVGHKPKYIVSDRGRQFDCDAYKGKKGWCVRHGIKPRFGAVGKYGSIGSIERFNRTLKYEGLFLTTIPFRLEYMRTETHLIIEHHNRFRPHQGLNGRTPDEVYFDREPANEKPRWEVRPKWPETSGCAAPYAPVKGECGVRLRVEVRYLEDRKHLPVFKLRKAA